MFLQLLPVSNYGNMPPAFQFLIVLQFVQSLGVSFLGGFVADGSIDTPITARGDPDRGKDDPDISLDELGKTHRWSSLFLFGFVHKSERGDILQEISVEHHCTERDVFMSIYNNWRQTTFSYFMSVYQVRLAQRICSPSLRVSNSFLDTSARWKSTPDTLYVYASFTVW